MCRVDNSSVTFSVIVPAYNSEKYIDSCIRSVLTQTYRNFELVIVNDGSSDGTAEILDKYASCDSRIKVFHKENGGHTSARNYGLRNSIGKYVVFLDSDDEIEVETLSQCYNKIILYAPDIVIFGIRPINGADDLFSIGIEDGFYRLSDEGDRLLEQIIMAKDGTSVFPKSLSGKAFLREKLLPHQLQVPEDVRVGEDGACFVRVFLSCESVSVISGVNYLCTINSGSISHSSDRYALRRYLSLCDYYSSGISEKGDSIKEQFRRYAVHHLFASLQFVAASDVGKKHLRSEFKEVMKNEIVIDAVKHAKFDKKAKKMRFKHILIRHAMLFVVRFIVRKKSTIS